MDEINVYRVCKNSQETQTKKSSEEDYGPIPKISYLAINQFSFLSTACKAAPIHCT